MLYLFDDDKYDAIKKTYNCSFIFEDLYRMKVRYFRNEDEIDIHFNHLTKDDIVCYHNSFPDDRLKFIQNLLDKNESNPLFVVICFSGDSSFLNHSISTNYLKIHKDRFYYNLHLFIESNFEINKLIFGKFDKRNEAKIIIRRINNILFYQSNENYLDIKDLQVRDLKRICELSSFDYKEFIQLIEDKTIKQFKNIINTLIQNI